MGNENPNAQIEANLLEGKNRYASAGTTLQDILIDLDNIAAGLQSSWLGPACQDYQDKHGKLTTTVQSASDVLQKGSTSIGKMYDSYLEADEKQKVDKEIHETLEMFMGVFMIVTSLLGLIGPILEAADLLFGIEIEALDIGIEVGEVATDVAEDVAIEEVETLSSLDTLGDIDPLNGEIPDPIDNPPEAPPQDTPVDTPLTEDTPPNVEEPSEEPTPESSKHDSGIELNPDEQNFLGKLDESTVSQTQKEIAPQEPITAYPVDTDIPDEIPTANTADSPNPSNSSHGENSQAYQSNDGGFNTDDEDIPTDDSIWYESDTPDNGSPSESTGPQTHAPTNSDVNAPESNAGGPQVTDEDFSLPPGGPSMQDSVPPSGEPEESAPVYTIYTPKTILEDLPPRPIDEPVTPHPPPPTLEEPGPLQATAVDPNTGNTITKVIDADGNLTTTVADVNGNTTVTYPNGVTAETITIDGQTTQISSKTDIDPWTRDVYKTEQIIEPDGSSITKVTKTSPDGTTTVTVTQTPPTSQAGPSSQTDRPPKRPFEDDPDSPPPDPSDPKGKKTKF